MHDQPLPLAADARDPSPIHAVRPDGLPELLGSLDLPAAAYLGRTGFAAAAQQLALLPDAAGRPRAVVGLGDDRSPFAFGELAQRLPCGDWTLVPGDYDPADAVLGFCLGAYAFRAFKAPKREPARLLAPAGTGRALAEARAAWMVRDLINTPANHQGPADLARSVQALATQFGAEFAQVDGEALEREYPAIAAVGRGSTRSPVVATLRWHGSTAVADGPLVALCGKGVVFDTGGYDLKPSAAMLRMKKDMGGAATMLGVARLLMEADVPARLVVRIGCVENSVSGHAMRPSDVIRTRRGLSIEIGNTDAEGRLVLADLLAEASDERPSLLVDCATLTGAARVALGPDLPALFCSDDEFAARLLAAGVRRDDPLWRLPLWHGYAGWLDSGIADLNNVSSKPTAGAVVAALFLARFISSGEGGPLRWAHLDLYAWNDSPRPGRPEGGEAQAMRALADTIADDVLAMSRNRPVT